VRMSQTDADTYSISVVQDGNVRHIRVITDDAGYYINKSDEAASGMESLIQQKVCWPTRQVWGFPLNSNPILLQLELGYNEFRPTALQRRIRHSNSSGTLSFIWLLLDQQGGRSCRTFRAMACFGEPS
jgi:hypothetical protein